MLKVFKEIYTATLTYRHLEQCTPLILQVRVEISFPIRFLYITRRQVKRIFLCPVSTVQEYAHPFSKPLYRLSLGQVLLYSK